MDTALFDYELPEDRIAQAPVAQRDESRLMVVNRQDRSVIHARFRDLPDYLLPRTRLIRNTVSVLKARLRGTRPTGGAVECLLLQPGAAESEWWCLVKPGKRLPVGAAFSLAEGTQATVVEKAPGGEVLVRFITPHGLGVVELAGRHGEMPLPPYIRRVGGEDGGDEDEERYQTIYADPAKRAAVAAPTAGLHFTPELDQRLKAEGHELLPLTLNVGMGTFKPIQVERLEEHRMHSEYYHVPAETLAALSNRGHPRLAVGTTSLRAIEDCARKLAGATQGASFESSASLFIYPPDTFHIDHLITNFHLPRSTLLCLVSAFLTPGSTDGINWLKDLYREAIVTRYRFYSYGDAMLII